jgi:hypothetical protein
LQLRRALLHAFFQPQLQRADFLVAVDAIERERDVTGHLVDQREQRRVEEVTLRGIQRQRSDDVATAVQRERRARPNSESPRALMEGRAARIVHVVIEDAMAAAAQRAAHHRLRGHRVGQVPAAGEPGEELVGRAMGDQARDLAAFEPIHPRHQRMPALDADAAQLVEQLRLGRPAHDQLVGARQRTVEVAHALGSRVGHGLFSAVQRQHPGGQRRAGRQRQQQQHAGDPQRTLQQLRRALGLGPRHLDLQFDQRVDHAQQPIEGRGQGAGGDAVERRAVAAADGMARLGDGMVQHHHRALGVGDQHALARHQLGGLVGGPLLRNPFTRFVEPVQCGNAVQLTALPPRHAINHVAPVGELDRTQLLHRHQAIPVERADRRRRVAQVLQCPCAGETDQAGDGDHQQSQPRSHSPLDHVRPPANEYGCHGAGVEREFAVAMRAAMAAQTSVCSASSRSRRAPGADALPSDSTCSSIRAASDKAGAPSRPAELIREWASAAAAAPSPEASKRRSRTGASAQVPTKRRSTLS